MNFYADLHIHSKYSRATSKNCDLMNLALWARHKGISVLGTGDFTHPEWMEHLKKNLVASDSGLLQLTPELQREVDQKLPPACRGPVYFMLCVEISTIYKKGEKTRKVHHVIYVRDYDAAHRLIQKLSKIGNLKSDGRPILGLDSRDLLEIVLESGEDSFLVPAHIWTPWFSAMGSKSGFDSIDECYADLAPHIFAVETGLSSDPQMNWRVSSLDRFRLVSNSDAHSPAMLGREACIFDTDFTYDAIRDALQTGNGYVGTVEFHPEEGKYHLDGHRKCGVRLTPEETRKNQNLCPVCKKPVTVGVMNRVQSLADRASSEPPETAGVVRSLIPLAEILSEIQRVGPKSKSVSNSYHRLVSLLGSELAVLSTVPLEEIERCCGELLVEAIRRLRDGKVYCKAGYDGEFGTIHLFSDDELGYQKYGPSLFADQLVGTVKPESPKEEVKKTADGVFAGGSFDSRIEENQHGSGQALDTVDKSEENDSQPLFVDDQKREETEVPKTHQSRILSRLDADQEAAAGNIDGPTMIIAGPGSGKTRTLTHRIAHLIVDHSIPEEECLAITFTRRAAEELNQRLSNLVDSDKNRFEVYTFHALGLSILKEHGDLIDLGPELVLVNEPQKLALLSDIAQVSQTKAQRLLKSISIKKRTGASKEDIDDTGVYQAYVNEMSSRNWLDFDDLIGLSIELLEKEPTLRATYEKRYRWISVDEFQDLDAQQYHLMRLICPPNGNLCIIGDPDQAIYGFRGSDRSLFRNFQADYPDAKVFHLNRNYRSTTTIVNASSQVIAAQRFAGPAPRAQLTDSSRITIHRARTEFDEARFIVQTIEQLMGGHSFMTVQSGSNTKPNEPDLSFSDFAILYRMDALTETVCQVLEKSGIPYQKRSHHRLYEQPGVSQIIEYIKDHEGEGDVRARLKHAVDCLLEINRGDGDENVPANLLCAAEMLMPLAEDCRGDLSRFISEIQLGAQVDTWDPRAERVSLLTLHASKGLEFRNVFIIGCEKGILPLKWMVQDKQQAEEEMRLFYVGMTRAQESLFLSFSEQRFLQNKQSKQEPSPFLGHIQEQLLERTKASNRRKNKETTNGQLRLF